MYALKSMCFIMYGCVTAMLFHHTQGISSHIQTLNTLFLETGSPVLEQAVTSHNLTQLETTETSRRNSFMCLQTPSRTSEGTKPSLGRGGLPLQTIISTN